MADSIADMLIRIRNAQMVKKRSVVVPHSDIVHEVLRVLKETGFVQEAVKRGRRNRRVLDVALLYDAGGSGHMRGARRVSKQSKRVYARACDLRPSKKSAKGIFIVSTSSGIMSSSNAHKSKVGGEVLCEIW